VHSRGASPPWTLMTGTIRLSKPECRCGTLAAMKIGVSPLFSTERVCEVGILHHSYGGSATIIHYEFPTLIGGMVSGKSSSQRKGVATGAVMCVVYDPDNPRRSSVNPLELVA